MMTAEEEIAALKQTLSEAQAYIQVLESLLAKKSVAKNSSNSHNPPSSDKAPKKNRSLREKSGKPPGGQPGHKGDTLKMSDSPDEVEPLIPHQCNQCGGSLEGIELILKSRRQVIDLPPIRPLIKEYRCYGAQCSCGHHQQGEYPSWLKSHVQYGPNIQSLIVYQSYYQFMPFARLQDFMSKVCGVNMSKGTIENILRGIGKKAEPLYAVLKESVQVAPYVGADETSFKVKGEKNWFWVWQSAHVTYIVAALSRAKSVIEEHFAQGFPASILGSDRLAAHLSTLAKGHQICLPHLLRDLIYLIQISLCPWPTKFKDLLKEAIALKQKKPAYDEEDPELIEFRQKFEELIQNDQLIELEKEPLLNKEVITFFKSMVKRKDNLFIFLTDPEVPYDNNASERAFRMVKVKMKVSGQFKSLQESFAIIRSVIDSAAKNDVSVFDAISALVRSKQQTNGAAG
jgi:transposase